VKGDIVRGDIKAETDEQVLIDEKDFEFRVSDEGLAMLPGLVEQVVGLAKGADVQAQIEGPEDFPNPKIAGKTVRYHIGIHDVKEDKLAEWNDDLVKEVGEGFDTIEQLADHIRDDVQAAADAVIRRDYEEAVIDALADRAQIEYPMVLLDHEIEHVLEDQAGLDARDPKAQELYLARVGKSEDEVKEMVRPEAEKRLLRGLVLSKFEEAENIKVLDDDVAAEVERMAGTAGEQAASIRELLSTGNLRDSIARNLYTQRVMDRLVGIASGGASGKPAAAPEKSSEEEKPKRRRSSPRKAETE
jgi:trigger factor